jgi:hypothetical protein
VQNWPHILSKNNASHRILVFCTFALIVKICNETKLFILGRCTSSSFLVIRHTSYLHTTNIFHTTLFELFYLFILFCLKKKKKRVKPGHLQQIKKKIMSVIFLGPRPSNRLPVSYYKA